MFIECMFVQIEIYQFFLLSLYKYINFFNKILSVITEIFFDVQGIIKCTHTHTLQMKPLTFLVMSVYDF